MATYRPPILLVSLTLLLSVSCRAYAAGAKVEAPLSLSGTLEMHERGNNDNNQDSYDKTFSVQNLTLKRSGISVVRDSRVYTLYYIEGGQWTWHSTTTTHYKTNFGRGICNVVRTVTGDKQGKFPPLPYGSASNKLLWNHATGKYLFEITLPPFVGELKETYDCSRPDTSRRITLIPSFGSSEDNRPALARNKRLIIPLRGIQGNRWRDRAHLRAWTTASRTFQGHLSGWTFSIEDIPDILEDKGWQEAAALQRLWFSLRNPGKVGDDGFDWNLPINSSIITMEWALKSETANSSRATDAYKKLANLYFDRSLVTHGHQYNRLEARLKARFASLNNPQSISYGDIPQPADNAGAEAWKEFVFQYTEFTKVPSYGWHLTSGADPLTAALNGFGFFLIPKGVAVKTEKGFIFTFEKLGIFIGDSFDFQGFQPLGYWRNPDFVSVNPFTDSYYVANSDYRDYRRATGRGGDFSIFSKVRWIDPPPPIRFEHG